MTDVEKQATSIIREWTSLTREHAALLALKLNKAGLLIAPGDDRDSRAQFEAWQRNTAERTKAGSVGVVPDEELRALLGKYNGAHYIEGADNNPRRITSPKVLTKIEEYIQEYWPYDNTKKYPRIIGAYEGEYFYGSPGPDMMCEWGIFIEWEDDFDGYVGKHEQFIDVTVDELMRGDG